MKALVLVVLGAVAYHFYVFDADREAVIYKAKSMVHATANKVADESRPTIFEKISHNNF